MRGFKPDSSASLQQQLERFAGDAVLGVIQKQSGGPGSHALAAFRILGEQFAQMQALDFFVVCSERLPRRTLRQRFDNRLCAHGLILKFQPGALFTICCASLTMVLKCIFSRKLSVSTPPNLNSRKALVKLADFLTPAPVHDKFRCTRLVVVGWLQKFPQDLAMIAPPGPSPSVGSQSPEPRKYPAISPPPRDIGQWLRPRFAATPAMQSEALDNPSSGVVAATATGRETPLRAR